METTTKLQAAGESEEVDHSFDYRGVIGSLMYLATTTRPDLSYAVGQLSRFVSRPMAKHCGALKRVLRYLMATKEEGIIFDKRAAAELRTKVIIDGRGIANVLMEVLPVKYPVELRIGVDNQATLALVANPTYSRRTRHIELSYHYVRDQAAQGQVVLWKVAVEVNPADAFTKRFRG
eukprot:jgi/Phyca11/101733/e_gw1.6.97.1